jgi:hypothetical protein
MTPLRDEDAGRHGADSAPPKMPWWTNGRVRLSLLLACLAVAIFALLGGSTGFSLSSGRNALDSGRSCVPPTPPLAKVSESELRDLHAGLLEMMAPLARARYAWGTVAPKATWSDEQPLGLRSAVHSSRPAEWLWPASFEMRSWTVDPKPPPAQEDIGADVFMFADSAEARGFFVEASSARCHRDGVEGSAPEPPQAHTLAWVNPDDAAEEDVFLLRVRACIASSSSGRENAHHQPLSVRPDSRGPPRSRARSRTRAASTRLDTSLPGIPPTIAADAHSSSCVSSSE